MPPLQELPPLNVPALLRQHGLRPDKRLGQNFLINAAALRQIVQAADIQAGDTVLEIGPGLGSLTRHLAAEARQVIAVELDGRLLPVLRQTLGDFPNVRIVQGDILQFEPDALMADIPAEGYRVVANIPYYITSAIIRHLLNAQIKPVVLVLTVQREVAERICAAPGALSLLALGVQVFGRPRITAHIPAGAFYPPPTVSSAVVRVELYPHPRIPSDQLETFFRLAKAGFGQKRKTLRNALAAGLGRSKDEIVRLLNAAGIEPQRRAQTLSLEEWNALTRQATDEWG